MSDERRLRKRVHLSVYLAADNTSTGKPMGNLVDINPAGFLLLTADNYTTGEEFSVNIHLPETIDEQAVINCKATAVRSRKSANPDFNEVAFEVIYMSSESKKIVEEIQAKWHLNFPD